MVHLTTTVVAQGLDLPPGLERGQDFCEECADEFFARTPGMNFARGLICLSDRYRSKLYDLLEAEHSEAFDISDAEEASRRGGELMRQFLKEQLAKDRIELNDDGLAMLCHDFYGSHHFYSRVQERKRKKG